MVNRIVIASLGSLGRPTKTMSRLHTDSQTGYWISAWRENLVPKDFDESFYWTGGQPVESILEVLCSEGMVSWN